MGRPYARSPLGPQGRGYRQPSPNLPFHPSERAFDRCRPDASALVLVGPVEVMTALLILDPHFGRSRRCALVSSQTKRAVAAMSSGSRSQRTVQLLPRILSSSPVGRDAQFLTVGELQDDLVERH